MESEPININKTSTWGKLGATVPQLDYAALEPYQNGTESLSSPQIESMIELLAADLDHRFLETAPILAALNGAPEKTTTTQLLNLAAETAASLTLYHPDHALLGGRLALINLYRQTPATLEVYAKALAGANILAPDVAHAIISHKEHWATVLETGLDFTFDYFAIRTLERSYLLRIDGKLAERPQQLWLRLALGITRDNLPDVEITYRLLSRKLYIHATPTLFNAGTVRPQLSSCFLLTLKSPDLRGVYQTLGQCAEISELSGGIGLSVHDVPASGGQSTPGMPSGGLVPMLRVFNETARYVDQGGGRRKGAFAVYLEPWHEDVLDFLALRSNSGVAEMRARDLFYALWVPDLFMQRVRDDAAWSLFSPETAPGLEEVWGEAFDKLYTEYEAQGLARETLPARKVWQAILSAQIETGGPYLLYKDACNQKSNQRHLGTIKSSNLCSEIIEYTAPDEVAVCNLASISLSAFVAGGVFDFEALHAVARLATRNLNRVIDCTLYPVNEAQRSNYRHRPVGLGVQGLADVFLQLGMAFDSPAATELNKDIFETIYHAALTESTALAVVNGAHETYAGSPAASGLLQPDLWNTNTGKRWDWPTLRSDIQQHGLRNSLLVALMPTASTSQILGNNECFEPYTSNLYVRRVLSGEFIVANRHLVQDLIQLGLWDKAMIREIMAADGSVQKIERIPADLRARYKTAFELKQKTLLDLAAGRAPFVCQSQSLNVFFEQPTFAQLTSMHFYGWELGLKTGMYYLRTRPAASPIKFTMDPALLAIKSDPTIDTALLSCSLDDANCDSCGG